MFMRSERLFLRPGWPEDWQELFARIRDEDIVRNMVSAPWPYTIEDAREFSSRVQQTGLPHFFVTLPGKKGSDLIGCVGLSDLGAGIELGYWIARDYWGNGYATEASQAVLRLARALGHRRILASYFHDNPASGRVLEKAGFKPTGQNLRRFSLARGEQVASVECAIDLQTAEREHLSDDDPEARMAA